MRPLIREYTTIKSGDGFDIVDIRTGEIAGYNEDEDWASFMAQEMFCDDEVMIEYENDDNDRFNPRVHESTQGSSHQRQVQ